MRGVFDPVASKAVALPPSEGRGSPLGSPSSVEGWSAIVKGGASGEPDLEANCGLKAESVNLPWIAK